MANKPFWLQLVGTGMTAAWALHFAAVLSHATWPSVNCHQLFVHPLIKPAIAVANGTAAIPGDPGLGVAPDDDAVEKYRIEPLARPPAPPDALIAVRWPNGSSYYYAFSSQYWSDFRNGRAAGFVKGVRFEYVPDNGSREWKELHERAKKNPVFSTQRAL
jgi:galactonate dehydratase